MSDSTFLEETRDGLQSRGPSGTNLAAVRAVGYTHPDQRVFYITYPEANIPEAWTRGAEIITLDSKSFEKFVRSFEPNNGLAQALLFERLVPQLRFCPESLIPRLQDPSFHFRASLADFFLKYAGKLKDARALACVLRTEENRTSVELPPHVNATWISGRWFAFATLDDAMLVRFLHSRSVVIEL
jgi:hypothetical protein